MEWEKPQSIQLISFIHGVLTAECHPTIMSLQSCLGARLLEANVHLVPHACIHCPMNNQTKLLDLSPSLTSADMQINTH